MTHDDLALASLMPVVGPVFAVCDMAWYVAEGQYLGAVMASIPFAKPAARAVAGGARGLVGASFEKWLQTALKASGNFKVAGREFDGAVGSRWIEAKSGRYWTDHAQPGSGFEKFKSDIGSKLRIAVENKATLEVHSNTPIPQHVQDWLTKKGISFFTH